MAGNGYSTLINGVKQIVRAIQASAGAADAGKIIALNASGLVDPTMVSVAGAIAPGTNVTRTGSGTVADPYVFSATGSGTTTVTCITNAAISAGQLVNFYSNGGVLTARVADNTSAGSEANGFATAGVGNAQTGTFTLSGVITGLTGLTVGATYFLGVNGAVTTVAPTAALSNLQVVGKAISTTQLEFNPDPAPTTLA